jgi:hypothetical protein
VETRLFRLLRILRTLKAGGPGVRLHHKKEDKDCFESLEAAVLEATRRGDSQVTWPPVSEEEWRRRLQAEKRLGDEQGCCPRLHRRRFGSFR